MTKTPFVSKEVLEIITEQFPTPFHLYDEKGIREKARALNAAFAWNKGFKEYFAVKACPNPFLMKIVREEGFGMDCSSLPELLLSESIGAVGEEIMFTSNDTPADEFLKAKALGAIINLDDISHIDFLAQAAGVHSGIRQNTSKKDLTMIVSDCACAAAAVYTQNKVFGAQERA